MNKKKYDKMFKENLQKLKITQKGIEALSNYLQQKQIEEEARLTGKLASCLLLVNKQDLAEASETIYKIASRLRRINNKEDE